MQCEICGKEEGKLSPVKVEGTIMEVCSACSHYGTQLQQNPVFSKKLREPTQRILDSEDTLVPGYGEIIRHAREKRGMTIEDLGKKVFEKASFLHRIEAESAKPDNALAGKIEKELGIKIS